jgi:23S rRNA maturation-related 3'-5' exoribonuclease YhaM
MRERIEELLMSTNREGMANLLQYMRSNGFYEAPCSSQYHLCKEGGLVEHSLNVFNVMFDIAAAIEYLKPLIEDTERKNSVIIVSLLHDLGKAGQFGKQNYVPNMVKSRKKDEGMIRSESKPFETNKELLPIPHEIRSIQIASQFIELTEEENFAIVHHNGLYGDLKYQLSGKERPLQMLLHWADMWASRVIEK